MSDIDCLVNRGVYRSSSTLPNEEESTLLVIGLARSGTSILAGALRRLGLFMGDSAGDRPSNEDGPLRDLVLAKDWDSADELIARYNRSHKKWGTKIPGLVDQMEQAHSSFRNPRYIIIFRDVFSVANRDRISMRLDLLGGISRSIEQYRKICDFLVKNNPDCLMVSFDTALNDKEVLIEELVAFCQLRPSKQQIEDAVAFITRNPEDYLRLSRITISKGYVQSVDGQSVSGWARYVNDERVATVILKSSGDEIARVEANLFREDLRDAGVHSTGHCAFEFTLPEGMSGDDVTFSVRVLGDVDDLPFEVISTDA